MIVAVMARTPGFQPDSPLKGVDRIRAARAQENETHAVIAQALGQDAYGLLVELESAALFGFAVNRVALKARLEQLKANVIAHLADTITVNP